MKIPEIIKIQSEHKPGSLASILTAIAQADLVVEGLESITRDHVHTTWEITLDTDNRTAVDNALARINELPNARVLGRSDRVLLRYCQGKIKTISTKEISSLEVLRDLYTPGVARVCLAIQEDPSKAKKYTNVSNTVAIVTDGTAVLGLGNIGPIAGLPVMEGKSALFAQLVGISGVPILMSTSDPKTIIDTVVAIAPSFGAIQLEDIAAPACFEIEDALKSKLDIPVMHDDQHGTAVVVLGALLGALRYAGLALEKSIVGQIGLGAAGLGISRLLLASGVRKLLGSDLNSSAQARLRAMGGTPVSLEELMATADVVIATTGVKGLIKSESVRKGQVILALSNPEPEISVRDALAAGASFAADGKVVNNVLGFPGIFRGALDAGATKITDLMLMAAAKTLSELSDKEALIPDPLDKEVHKRVAAAVALAAGGEA